jgi:hypothetical protein
VREFFQALRAFESLNKTGLGLSKKEAIFFSESFAVKKLTVLVWAIWCHGERECKTEAQEEKSNY